MINGVAIKKRILVSLFLILFFPVIAWVLNSLISGSTLSADFNDWETFASFISGTTGVIGTIIGLSILIFTFKKEVNEEEIRNTERIKRENDALRLEVENNIFRLYDFHRSCVSDLYKESSTTGEPAITGKTVLKEIAERMKIRFMPHRLERDGVHTIDELVSRMNTEYANEYKENNELLHHYFRTLYHVFKYIYHAPISQKYKDDYAKMIGSQLTIHEVVLLGLNAKHSLGTEFCRYVEEYSLLHRLIHRDVFRIAFISQFKSSAFGKESLNEPMPESSDKVIISLYSQFSKTQQEQT